MFCKEITSSGMMIAKVDIGDKPRYLILGSIFVKMHYMVT